MTDAEALALLHEAYQALHLRRFEHQDGRGSGPDSFYAGIGAAKSELLAIAERRGFTGAEVYHGRTERDDG